MDANQAVEKADEAIRTMREALRELAARTYYAAHGTGADRDYSCDLAPQLAHVGATGDTLPWPTEVQISDIDEYGEPRWRVRIRGGGRSITAGADTPIDAAAAALAAWESKP